MIGTIEEKKKNDLAAKTRTSLEKEGRAAPSSKDARRRISGDSATDQPRGRRQSGERERESCR